MLCRGLCAFPLNTNNTPEEKQQSKRCTCTSPCVFSNSSACYSDLNSLWEEGNTILPDRMQRPQSSPSAVCLTSFSCRLGLSFACFILWVTASFVTFFPSFLWLIMFLSGFISAHLKRGTRHTERQRRVKERWSKRERETTGLLLRSWADPKCPVSSLPCVLGHRPVCACECVCWRGCSPFCQPVSVPVHRPRRTHGMSYDPDALVTTALKYLPWAQPGLAFFFSLSLFLSVSISVCHSLMHTVTHLSTLCTSARIHPPFSFFSSHAHCAAVEAINSSAVSCCFCLAVIDVIWVDRILYKLPAWVLLHCSVSEHAAV